MTPAGTGGTLRQSQQSRLDWSLRMQGLLLLAIPFVALLAGLMMSWRALAVERAADVDVTRTLEVKISLREVLALVIDSESASRGMLLTSDREFLEPYESALIRWPGALTTLRNRLTDNPDRLAAVARLESLADERFRLLGTVLTTAPGAVPDLAVMKKGKQLTNEIRSIVEGMHRDEDALLIAHRGQIAAARRSTLAGLLATVALGGASLGAMAFVVGKTATRLQAHHEEVVRSRDELDQFFSLSTDMLSIIGSDGRFTRVNPAWETALGLRAAELVGAPYLDFVHPDDRDASVAEQQRLATGARTIGFDNRYRTHDGTYRWMSWNVAPNQAGNLFYSVTRDVTESRRLAAELEHRTELLADANRELEAFAYSVSHDLRAPLRHINGFAKLLEHSSQAWDDSGRGFLKKIRGAATKMAVLIDDLLGFSRMGQIRLSRGAVDLAALTAAVRDEVVTGIDHHHIEWRVHELPVVRADAAMLRLVVTNLFSNAVKYSSPREPAVIEVGTMPSDASEHVVFVRDNGVGFDMSYIDKLFGVFQRLHSSDDFEGTGIGLANVRRIVQRHGGRVWAEGVVGSGATFYFSLPREEATSDDS